MNCASPHWVASSTFRVLVQNSKTTNLLTLHLLTITFFSIFSLAVTTIRSHCWCFTSYDLSGPLRPSTQWPQIQPFDNLFGDRNLSRMVRLIESRSGLIVSEINNRSDFENEELRVQVNALRYELDNLKQERDLTALRHEKELRDLQLRADSDFRKAQVRIITNLFAYAVQKYSDNPNRALKQPVIEPPKKAKLSQKN